MRTLMVSRNTLRNLPRFIHVEVNTLVPPPIVYRPLHVDPDVKNASDRSPLMLHCSLSAFVMFLEPFGYDLVKLAMGDAVIWPPLFCMKVTPGSCAQMKQRTFG